MISACLLLWCLGQPIAPADRATFATDVRHSNRTERIFGYELSWLVAGAVMQTTAPDAVFAGVLPLNIRLLGDRLMFTGGAVLASDTSGGRHARELHGAAAARTDRSFRADLLALVQRASWPAQSVGRQRRRNNAPAQPLTF